MIVRALIADDHSAVRDGLIAALATVPDVEVLGAAQDGAEALRLAHELRPEVVILDLHLPGLSGLAVLRGLSSTHPGVRVVAYSADVRLRRDALELGACAFVPKGAPLRELLEAIRAAARTRVSQPSSSVGALTRWTAKR